MKKFDTLIASFLYTNKTVDIEGLGTFSVDENFVLPPDTEKTTFFPLEGIQFNYDPKIPTSPALLDYLVQQTGKIRSLITSDFVSYIAEIRQFVNIGKPWVIEGIGTLQKNKEGRFELVPGEALSERINVHYVEENAENAEPVKRNRWIVGLLFTIAVVAVVAGLGFGIYALFFQGKGSHSAEQATTTAPAVDTQVVAVPKDTIFKKPDSLNAPAPAAADSSFNYKAYIETTKWKERVEKRTAQLSQYGIKSYYDSMIIRDTLRYRMYVYQRIFPADSLRLVHARDSLSSYFGRRVRLEKIK